jgi:hypothetical protein
VVFLYNEFSPSFKARTFSLNANWSTTTYVLDLFFLNQRCSFAGIYILHIISPTIILSFHYKKSFSSSKILICTIFYRLSILARVRSVRPLTVFEQKALLLWYISYLLSSMSYLLYLNRRTSLAYFSPIFYLQFISPSLPAKSASMKSKSEETSTPIPLTN